MNQEEKRKSFVDVLNLLLDDCIQLVNATSKEAFNHLRKFLINNTTRIKNRKEYRDLDRPMPAISEPLTFPLTEDMKSKLEQIELWCFTSEQTLRSEMHD